MCLHCETLWLQTNMLAESCFHCIPVIHAGSKCPCGADWCTEDPVAQQWIQQKDARLSTMYITTRVDVYYRYVC
jgi:hypothetical protein